MLILHNAKCHLLKQFLNRTVLIFYFRLNIPKLHDVPKKSLSDKQKFSEIFRKIHPVVRGCVCVGVWVCGGGCVGVGVGGARPKVKTKKLRFFRIFFLNWSVRTRQFHCPIRTFQFCRSWKLAGWWCLP